MDKAELMTPRIREALVPVGDGKVRVRGLKRPEAIAVAAIKDDIGAQERLGLLYGLVDPALTEAEVAAYHATADAGEVQLLVSAIQDLSMAGKEGTKSGVPGVRGRRGT